MVYVTSRKIQIFITILLAGIITSLCAKSLRYEGIRVDIVARSSVPIEYQLFYQEKEADLFQPEKMLRQEGQPGQEPERLQFMIPASQIHGLRLDIDSAEAGSTEVLFYSLAINGKTVPLNTSFLPESWNQDSTGQKLEPVTLNVTGETSCVLPINESGFSAQRHYEWLPLFSVFVLSFLILYGLLFQYLSAFYMTHRSAQVTEALCFLGGIGLLLIMPSLHIDHSSFSSRENRALAAFPAFMANGGGRINSSFGRQFEEWFNDRFFGRAKYIALQEKVDSFFNLGRKENQRAFEGENGWLFFKGDNSVALFQRKYSFEEEQLKKIKANLESQKQWLQAHGAVYSVLIAPNKEDVYGEFYKRGIRRQRDKDRVEELEAYLREAQCSVDVIYPLQELLDKKKNEKLLYWKMDTHWNAYGAYWGYLTWMTELQKQVGDVDILMPDQLVTHDIVKNDGDLANMLGIKPSDVPSDTHYVELVPREGWPYQVLEEREATEKSPTFVHTVCPGKKHKVVVFHDSFAVALRPYLSSTFGEVLYIWSHDLNDYAELIRREKPDLVLHEAVSRYAHVLLRNTDSWQDEVK